MFVQIFNERDLIKTALYLSARREVQITAKGNFGEEIFINIAKRMPVITPYLFR